jgi:hypothetical protein
VKVQTLSWKPWSKSLLQSVLFLFGLSGWNPKCASMSGLSIFFTLVQKDVSRESTYDRTTQLIRIKDHDWIRTHLVSLHEKGSSGTLNFVHVAAQESARTSSRLTRGFHSSGQARSIVAIAASVSS